MDSISVRYSHSAVLLTPQSTNVIARGLSFFQFGSYKPEAVVQFPRVLISPGFPLQGKSKIFQNVKRSSASGHAIASR